MQVTGAMLRDARETAGLSLGQMAERTYRSKMYLSRIERGLRKVPATLALEYERVIGQEMDRRGLIATAAMGVIAPAAIAQLLQEGFAAALRGRALPDQWQEREVGS